MIKQLCFICLLGTTYSINTLALELNSGSQQTTLLELYTSEGCSSCPPADHWLSKFKSDRRLWQKIVPVAFHVDYWNWLGWHDRFSNPTYSARQHNYRRYNYLNVVYTPGFVRNGREWRGWFEQQNLPINNTDVGILKAKINKTGIQAKFTPSRPIQKPLVLNIALLGFNQTSNIQQGENRGQLLKHDFVVMDFHQLPQSTDKQEHHWQLADISDNISTDVSGIAIWVTTEDDPTPLQATGGYLDVKKL